MQATGSGTVTYTYDGEGRRVRKVDAAGVTTVYAYNAFGELASEHTSAGPSGTAATYYLTTDHLGSTRLITDAGANVISRHDYLPFGEELWAGIGGRTIAQMFVANPALTQRFTGKERDTETGLDFSIARYYSAAMGRFNSADLPFIDQNLSDPQSWNLYSYVRNNPLVLVDPNGRTCVWNREDNRWTDVGSGQTCADVDANPVGDTTTVSGDGGGTDTTPSDPPRGPTGRNPVRQWIFVNAFSVVQRALCIGGWAIGGGAGGAIFGAGGGALAGGASGAGGGTLVAPGIGTLGGGAAGALGGAQAGAVIGGTAGFGGGLIAGSILCSSGNGGGGGGTPEGNSAEESVPLRPLHDEGTLSKTSLDYWRKQSTDDILKSLTPGSREALRVKLDGTIMNGNTRIQVLRERGVDVNRIARELY